MSSSTDLALASLTTLATPQLRTGDWTRLGDSAVLGDAVTEQVLGSLGESARAAAQAQGYAVGWAEGRRAAELQAAEVAAEVAARIEEAERRREAEHAQAVALLHNAAAALSARVGEACDRVEGQATDLAIAVTGVIVEETVAASGDTAGLAVRRALAACRDTGHPLVRLHLAPADAAAVAASGIVPAEVTVSPDSDLARGDALAELNGHVLDLRIETAMTRVRDALTGGDEQ